MHGELIIFAGILASLLSVEFLDKTRPKTPAHRFSETRGIEQEI